MRLPWPALIHHTPKEDHPMAAATKAAPPVDETGVGANTPPAADDEPEIVKQLRAQLAEKEAELEQANAASATADTEPAAAPSLATAPPADETAAAPAAADASAEPSDDEPIPTAPHHCVNGAECDCGIGTEGHGCPLATNSGLAHTCAQ
jgi:hypothetical protein